MVGHVPDSDTVVGADRSQLRTIGAERYRAHRLVMVQQLQLAAVGHIPDPDGVVRAAGGQPRAVRAECQRGGHNDGADFEQLLSVGSVPKLDSTSVPYGARRPNSGGN